MAPVFSPSGKILFQHNLALISIPYAHRIFVGNDVEAQDLVYRASIR